MPLYEYLCRTCGERFEELKPIANSHDDATCASGHPGAQRVVSLFATVGAACAAPSSGPT